MFKKIGASVCLLFAMIPVLRAQTPKDVWVDSVFQKMTIAEKIGQIFMITVSTNQDANDLNDVVNRIETNHFGGILFTAGKTLKQATLTNKYQSVSNVPLVIAFDGVSGLGTQLDSVIRFPSALALGSIADDSLLFDLGRDVARQMKLMGIHLNFLPANLADNPNTTPSLTFGADRVRVTSKTLLYQRGLESEGVLSCAKYFPIQGLSVSEAGKGLPAVTLSVDSTQAYPFKMLIKNQLPALMPAAADLPLFYSRKKTALKNLFSSSALTSAFAGKWIRENMDYDGLIMVDVDKMSGPSNKFSPGDAEVFAFQAGNDMLVTSGNVAAAIRKMKKLLRQQKALVPQLEASVKKILALKYDAGLAHRAPVETETLLPRLITAESRILQQKIYRSTATVISNSRNTLPIQSLENKIFTCIVAGDSTKGADFNNKLSRYIPTSLVNFTEKTDTLILFDPPQHQRVIIVAVFPGTTQATWLKLLASLQQSFINREVIVCDFGSPVFRPFASHFQTVITAFSDNKPMLDNIAQLIFGGFGGDASLPVAFGELPAGTAVKTEPLDRLTYSFPETAGMDSRTLDQIEAVANEAIAIGATPGCHVLVARKGKVVYEKSFGHYTYEKQVPVTGETIYDLASVTKVSATLQAVMFMHEKGLIDINKKASVYLPELKQSNKKDFILKDILTHQAGLWPGLPFWAQTVRDNLYLPEFYSQTLSPEYPYLVAEKLYASRIMKDSLWNWIVKARIREKPDRTPFDYRYSDMGFYILQRLAEKILNQPMQDFLAQNLYEPLGAYTTGYLPLVRFPVHRIAPTEMDKLFRRTLLIGTVHDQGAAMLGGAAGHAGLFSNANDLAKLGQMLLQEGHYGGIQYYKPETVRLFTQKQFNNSRRGLGGINPRRVTGTALRRITRRPKLSDIPDSPEPAFG
jgi:beta-N-acetylhexosaminidase